ncbi:MAG: hypothetical protein KatS3mg062_0850 [Tepidiforma sp.]|nr:MAG: hypothetical protein KatS3mg062_0850 [Tepidiforma sp.]
MPGTRGRAIDEALALARERLALLLEGAAVEEPERLEALDAALLQACGRAMTDAEPGDRQVLDELLAIHAAADRLIAAELEATGARLRRLRRGQSTSAAYRAGAGGL